MTRSRIRRVGAHPVPTRPAPNPRWTGPIPVIFQRRQTQWSRTKFIARPVQSTVLNLLPNRLRSASSIVFKLTHQPSARFPLPPTPVLKSSASPANRRLFCVAQSVGPTLSHSPLALVDLLPVRLALCIRHVELPGRAPSAAASWRLHPHIAHQACTTCNSHPKRQRDHARSLGSC